MTEQMARSLASILGGDFDRVMPPGRKWGVVLPCADGRFVAIEERSGRAYRDESAFDSCHQRDDPSVVLDSHEWDGWGKGEDWARKLSRLLGSAECRQFGDGIWLVYYTRSDGRFAVVGSDSGGVYSSRKEFESDGKVEEHSFF